MNSLNNTIMNSLRLFSFLIFSSIISILNVHPFLYAQDSLYLVDTMIGESYEKRITDIKTIGDINGDGFIDLMLSKRFSNTAELYLGSGKFTFSSPIIFTYPGTDKTYNEFGVSSGVGDINNDGYEDFTITAHFGEYSKGKVFLYYGSPIVQTTPIGEYSEGWIDDSFGTVIEKLGDLNKDDYEDFAISSFYNWNNRKGYVYIFWGGDSISFSKSTKIESPATSDDFFGQSVQNIGDINMDGYEDVAIGAPAISGVDTPKVYVYNGGKVFDVFADTIIKSNVLQYNYGALIKNAGDLNDDGLTDYFVGSYSGIVYLHKNGHLPIQIDGDSLGLGGYVNIEPRINLNNDNYPDFIIGNTNYTNAHGEMVGAVYIYYGSKNTNIDYDKRLEGESFWGEYSKQITHGDFNGDGYDEIIILEQGYPDYKSPLGKISIYSLKQHPDYVENQKAIAREFEILQNYPNPFNPQTKILYSVKVNSYITLKVFDSVGREVVELINKEVSPGTYSIDFNANNYHLTSGVYFCEINKYSYLNPSKNSKKGGYASVIKMLLLK